MKRTMFDIEAWDLKETALLLSVGIVDIDQEVGQVRHPGIEEQQRDGRTIGASTAQWWTFQSEAARITTLSDAIWRENPGITAAYIAQAAEEADEIWASGTSYDMKILSHFVKQYLPDYRWPFWKERDHRTVRELVDPHGLMKPSRGTEHDALEDAKFQAVYLKRLLPHVSEAQYATTEQIDGDSTDAKPDEVGPASP